MTRRIALYFALLLGASTSGHAAVFCVANANALQNALDTSTTNGADNTIKVRSGTFNAPSGGFTYTTTGGHALDIEGGWNAGCTVQTPDASLTVLDGQSTTNVLDLDSTQGSSSSGDLSVRYLSLLNASVSTSRGAALQASAAGVVHIENCRFRLNHADDPAATSGIIGMYAGSGASTFINNVVANNSALGSIFVLSANPNGASTGVTFYLNGNTIADNVFATDPGGQGTVFLFSQMASSLSNNILWNNGSTEFLQGVPVHPVLVNNDIDVMTGITPGAGSGGNISVDPQFVNANNHHLQSTSTLNNAGETAAPGGIGMFDLDGNARVAFGIVDIGAYEALTEPDGIFSNGFDGP